MARKKRNKLPRGVRKYIRRKKAESRKRGEAYSDEEFVRDLKKRLKLFPP